MRGVIYADILVAVNSLLGWFLLRAVGRLAGAACGGWRAGAGALLAGASSLLILLPPDHALVAFLAKAAAFCAIVAVSFPWKSLRAFVKLLLWYFLLNMLLGGAVVLGVMKGAGNLAYGNFSVYIYIEPLVLIFAALGVYLLVNLICWLFSKPGQGATQPITLDFDGAALRCTALLDTGFHLSDPITGRPAVMLSFPKVRDSLPVPLAQALARYYETGELQPCACALRLVPVRTADGESVMPCVTARLVPNKNSVCAVFTPRKLEGDFEAIRCPAD